MCWQDTYQSLFLQTLYLWPQTAGSLLCHFHKPGTADYKQSEELHILYGMYMYKKDFQLISDNLEIKFQIVS